MNDFLSGVTFCGQKGTFPAETTANSTQQIQILTVLVILIF